jgi:hypothetical protein
MGMNDYYMSEDIKHSKTNIYSETLSFSLVLYEIEPVHNENLSITSKNFFLEQFFVQANLSITNFFL